MKLKNLKYLVPLLIITIALGQKPYRYGTTAANFLEIGVCGSAIAMGEAYVSVGDDIDAIYWNPAGIASIKGTQFTAMNQGWIADISNRFAALAFNLPRFGSFAISIAQVDYGSIGVTNMAHQEGTGEYYDAMEYSFALTYGRSIVDWFSFGASGKYIASSIWHSSASALALDLGVKITTDFFSPTGEKADGMRIAMSISNYGTRMKYDGIDLLNPIDILPDENGNYADVQGQFRMQGWDLPLIFRVGFSVQPLLTHYQQLILAADVLHPNNNSESLNLGFQYRLSFMRGSRLFLRTGLKGISLINSSESVSLLGMNVPYSALTYGIGIEQAISSNKSVTIDYAYKSVGVLGIVNSFSVKLSF